MNQKTYEHIKKQIQDNFHEEMAHLEALAPRFGVFNKQVTLKPIQKALILPQKSEMKVLKEMPTNGANLPEARSMPTPQKYYDKKLQPCEIKDCGRNTQPEHKCPSCTKRICTRHLRGKVCQECNSRGEK